MRWVTGSDHAGFRLKQALIVQVRGWGDEIVDVGACDGETSVDYPDFARAACDKVLATPGCLGLLVCGSGTGISIAANKIPGIRAVRATDPWSARLAREHNDCNVVCLGERVTGTGLAEDIVRAFRDAAFAGGRHQARVDKLAALDAQAKGPVR
jgi:ribose 5-phosphate isomerase B